jgi:GH15 family glucan-1,4-alpha-glucosidase
VSLGAFTLRDHALLADGRRGAVIDPNGDIVWLCFPRWHDAALFSAMLGGGGHYAVTPVERFTWGGHYEPGGLIWRSRWVTESNAIVESREALARPGEAGHAVLLRRVVGLRERTKVRVQLELCGPWGRGSPEAVQRQDDGSWTARVDGIGVRWIGAPRARPDDEGGLELELDVGEGDSHDLVLVLGRPDGDLPDADALWRATEEAWKADVPDLSITGSAARDSRLACAVMRGLTTPGGGMVAAATTALPERADRGRDWDYRYVWMRDQAYAGQAAGKAGAWALLDDAVTVVAARLLEHGPRLSPAYTVDGGEVPEPSHVGLPGFPGGNDQIGNQVRDQFQLDAFGEALLLFAEAARHDRLDEDAERAVEVAVRAVADRWQEADAGVWEVDPDHWAHSKLICAAGLGQMATRRPAGPRAREWQDLARLLRDEADRSCLHPSGRWQRSPGDARVDAALLLASVRGAVPPTDPRSVATRQAIAEELARDGYLYRYRVDDAPLGKAEGAFLICSFWMALACDAEGRRTEAVHWFERGRAACGPAGLFCEEWDVGERQLRGNLPQAFVHALLLEAAVALADPDGAG